MDRFHVMQWVHKALKKVSASVKEELSSRSREILKKDRKLLRVARENLSVEQQSQLEIVLQDSSALKKAYELKECLRDFYEDRTLDISSAAKKFGILCKQAAAIGDKAMTKLSETLSKYSESIVNFHHYRATNGRVEGVNRLIKAMQRRRFGIANNARHQDRIIVEGNHRLIKDKFFAPRPPMKRKRRTTKKTHMKANSA